MESSTARPVACAPISRQPLGYAAATFDASVPPTGTSGPATASNAVPVVLSRWPRLEIAAVNRGGHRMAGRTAPGSNAHGTMAAAPAAAIYRPRWFVDIRLHRVDDEFVPPRRGRAFRECSRPMRQWGRPVRWSGQQR